MKKVKSTTLFLGLASAMAFAQDGAACVKFENGTGDYKGKCFNEGLLGMAEGKCYTLNPDRGDIKELWINNIATESWWWVETACGGEEPASSSSEDVSSSSEELSSSSEVASSSSEEPKSSSSEVVEPVEKCVAFVHGSGDYNGKCFNSGLNDMAEGKCYMLNPERGVVTEKWINNRAADTYWWVETPCVDEPESSSSVEVSSSSEEVSSSSEEVSSSSEEVSSSSEEVSSSSEEVSSSSEEVSSSSEEVSSSSEEVSSSSEEVSSSSEEVSSSSEEVSSSSEEVSSSSEEVSSSSEEVSSSSEVVEPVEKCVAFVHGSGDYNGKCFNSGLNDMAEGKCYMLNPERGVVTEKWINNRAADTYWWVETECFEGAASSSSEESSSSVEESSSSEEVSSSSEESSSSVEESSSSEVVSKCIAFVNGDGDYDKNCYNSGLDEMAEGKCYTMNQARVAESGVPQYISNRASDTWWWTETACADEPEVVEEPVIENPEVVFCKGDDCADVKPIAAEPKPAPQLSNGRDNGTLSVVTAVEAKASMVVMNNTLNIATTSNGVKSLKVFSVRGDMLLSETFSGASKSLDMSKFAGKGAVIIRLVEGRKVLATKRVAVR